MFVAGLSLDSGRLQLVHLKRHFEMNIVVSRRKLIFDANKKILTQIGELNHLIVAEQIFATFCGMVLHEGSLNHICSAEPYKSD